MTRPLRFLAATACASPRIPLTGNAPSNHDGSSQGRAFVGATVHASRTEG